MQNISAFCKVYTDESGKETFETITSNRIFKTVGKNNLNFGITKATVWLKFSLKNLPRKPLLLSVDNSTLTEISFFYPDSLNHYKQKITGESYPVATRDQIASIVLFNIVPPTEQEQTYYLRIKSFSPLYFIVSLGTQPAVTERLYADNLGMSIFLGMMLAISLLVLLVYFTIHDPNYLYYFCYLLSITFFVAYIKGYTHIIFKDTYPFNSPDMLLSASIAVMALTMFSTHLLQVKRYFPKIYPWLLVYAGLFVVQISLFLFLNRLVGVIILNYLGFLTLAFPVISYFTYQKQYRPALFYGIGWLFITGCNGWLTLVRSEILPYQSFVPQLFPAGLMGEVIFFSIAISENIQTLRRQKNQSQQALLQMVQQQNILLERNVKDRTLEISKKNNELEAQNEEIRLQQEE
ncbi:MAG: hypothetical protein H7Y04_11605, partial [Verrucomicrobia bacterium]|nr:hypothetical protein [Cytophagales bacterium]